jgi:group I intron endonuclease
MAVVYLILNKENLKAYIGKTVDFKRRKREHLNELRKGVHTNSHLQSAFNKYSEECFEFTILEECNKELLNEKEVYWINFFGGFNSPNTYNLCEGGIGGIFSAEVLKKLNGRHHTEASKKKMSDARKGIKLDLSEEQRRAIGERNKKYLTGRKHTEKSKEKMSVSVRNAYNESTSWGMSGKTHSEETKKKISMSEKGKIVTPETRIKISTALKNPTAETRKKMREGRIGKTLSEETKKKISESVKRTKQLKKKEVL